MTKVSQAYTDTQVNLISNDAHPILKKQLNNPNNFGIHDTLKPVLTIQYNRLS